MPADFGPPPRNILKFAPLEHTEACGISWGTSCLACCQVFIKLWEASQRKLPQKAGRKP